MSVKAVQTTQPNRVNYKKLTAAAGVGAAAGAVSRYVLPTKQELSSMFNKNAIDTFVSSASAQARSANRSILKYAGAGAVAAGLLALASKIFPKHNDSNKGEYSKYGALLDAPDYAVEIMWYGE